jgi:hypothetical protein
MYMQRVQPEIDRIDEDVVDVEQQAAAARFDDSAEEFPLGELRSAKLR